MSSEEVLVLRGTLEGHRGWVTSLSTSAGQPNLLLSASRDKTMISWKLTGEDQQFGVPVRSFHGHNHIVEDCTLTADGAYAVSSSWDKTLKLWQVSTGDIIQTFTGHKSDVMSVDINRGGTMIISGSRDKTVKVWTIHGECLATLLGHNDWVSQVRVAPSSNDSDSVTVISAGNDKVVKVCYFTNSHFENIHKGLVQIMGSLSIRCIHDMMFNIFATSDGKFPPWDVSCMRHYNISPRSLIIVCFYSMRLCYQPP